MSTSTLIKVQPTSRPAIRVTAQGSSILLRPQVVRVLTGAVRGPQGQAGANGQGELSFPFAYGDATPMLLTMVPAGKLIERVVIYIRDAFDGVGASLKIGDSLDNARLLGPADNDPGMALAYETHPDISYVTDTSIYLTINQGAGPTQGTGLVVVGIQN